MLGESSQKYETQKNHRRVHNEHARNRKTGGSKLKVEVGQAIYVEKLGVEAGQK